MNWTGPKPPTQGVSHYDHITCETPLGRALIEWKGWKENDSFSAHIGHDYIGEGSDLGEAKELTREWLTKKQMELSRFLSK